MNRKQLDLKESVIRAGRGPFTHWWEALLHLDHPLLARVHDYLSNAERGPLAEKDRHLLWLSVDTVVSHLYPRGAGVHARVALELGATVREVIEAIEIASTVSSQAYGMCLPIVVEACGGGHTEAANGPSDQADRLRTRLGYWEPWMDTALRVSPGYFAAMVELQAPQPDGQGLSTKVRQLILTATYGCPSVLNLEGVRRHAVKAVEAGATQAELVQALQLANGIGLHSISEAVMPLREYLDRQPPE